MTDLHDSALDRPRFDVWHEVPLVPQLTGMSCWAAAAAMIVGWRDCIDVRPEEVAAGLGRWDAYRGGLEPTQVDDLARVFDLVIEPLRTYSVEELRSLLARVGPLWVGAAVPGLHVVVAAGLVGDGTLDGTWVRVADPWPIGRGERYRVGFREFATNLVAASDVVGATAQVLHSNGRRAGLAPAGAGLAPARAGLAPARAGLAPAPGHVVLDPGHGGEAPAGRSSPFGVRGPGGTLEKTVTLALGRRVAARLGPGAVLTRDRDVNLTLADRSGLAHRLGAPVFVSIHANGGGPGRSGAEAYVHRRAGQSSHRLAAAIQGELSASPGLVAAEELAVLAPERLGPSTAACLLEVDYLSDPGGERRLRDPLLLDRIAHAIARGIGRHREG